MRSGTWDLCWPLQGWEHRFEIRILLFLFRESESVWESFQESESVWANSSDIPTLNFSPQSLELMRAWVVDTGLVPQVDVTKLLPSTIEERIFLNCELIFYPFWKSRLKEVMIQRATILGEYSPLQETGRNIKMTKWGGCRQFCNLSLNQTMGAWGQNCFCFFKEKSRSGWGGWGGREVSGPIILFHIGKVKIRWKLFPKEGTGSSANCLPEPKQRDDKAWKTNCGGAEHPGQGDLHFGGGGQD